MKGFALTYLFFYNFAPKQLITLKKLPCSPWAHREPPPVCWQDFFMDLDEGVLKFD